MRIRRVESVEGFNTVWSNTNANANEEKVREDGVVSSKENDEF
jgi:hypothetical protein